MSRLAFGIVTLLVGLVLVFVLADKYSVENLSPEFIAVLPPEFWKLAIVSVGGILSGIGAMSIWLAVTNKFPLKGKNR